jgi:hypothetical protein
MSQIIRVFLFGAFVFMKLTILGQKQNFTIDTTLVSGQITNLILNRPDFFYSKIGVEINASNPDFSADMRLSTRVKKDSLVFANANYMGIQAATVHITSSRGVLLNRFSKCYSEGNSELLSDLLGVELELLDLEEFILGLPVYFPKLNKSDLSFQNDSVGNNQVTYSGNMRMSNDKPKWVDIVYTFDDSLTFMKQMNIQIPSDSISVKWKCEEFQDVSSFRVPSLVTISIQRGVGLIDVQLKYNAVEINVPEKIEFEIPQNYEKCN